MTVFLKESKLWILTKGVQPSSSWLKASTSVSSNNEEFSALQCKRAQTNLEYPKEAAKCRRVMPLWLANHATLSSSPCLQSRDVRFWQNVTKRSSKFDWEKRVESSTCENKVRVSEPLVLRTAFEIIFFSVIWRFVDKPYWNILRGKSFEYPPLKYQKCSIYTYMCLRVKKKSWKRPWYKVPYEPWPVPGCRTHWGFGGKI